jgi:hypothetical protein
MVKSSVKPGDASEGGKNEPHSTIHPVVDLLRAGTLPFWCLSFFGGGIAAVLVDLDHIPKYVFNTRWLFTPLNVFHFGPGRFLHPALFFVGCGVLACAGGLLLIMVLSDFARALGEKRAIRARQRVVKVNIGRPGPASSISSIDITGAKKMPSKTDR